MEIEDLEYKKRPFNTNKVFEVHSLTNNGFTTYIGNESYTHKFLERTAPKIIFEKENFDKNLFYSSAKNKFSLRKSFLDKSQEEKENSNKIEYIQELEPINKEEEFIQENQYLIKKENDEERSKNFENWNRHCEQENENLNKNKDQNLNSHAKTASNFFNSNNFKNYGLLNKNHNVINDKKNTLLKTKNIRIKDSNNSNNFKFNTIYNNPTSPLPNNYNNTRYFSNIKNGLSTANPVIKNKMNKNFSISTEKTYYYQKSNMDLLSRRLNLTGSNFKKTFNTQSDSFANSRFDKNYLKNFNLFVKSNSYFNMDKIPGDQHKIKYDGFQSYNVPHVENNLSKNEKKEDQHLNGNMLENNYSKYQNSEKKIRKPTNIMEDKIAKSCTGNNKLSMELSKSTNKFKEIQEENEKLKKIVMAQTSTDFLKRNGLPEIQYCISQPKLKINKIDFIGGKVKHMGGRYNPYNFQAGRDCETNRRNQFGALFQH
jgi:hypothetical protein